MRDNLFVKKTSVEGIQCSFPEFRECKTLHCETKNDTSPVNDLLNLNVTNTQLLLIFHGCILHYLLGWCLCSTQILLLASEMKWRANIKEADGSERRATKFPVVPVLTTTAPHLSSLFPVHTGTSITRRKSFLSWKHAEIRLVGGRQHEGPTISCWTNRPVLSLTAHEGKKNR